MGRHFLVLLLSLLVLAGIAAADGIDSYTTLMLHMDDTGLTDSSDSSHTITKNDNADRSAVQSKFGGYSVYFDGAGDYLSSQDSVDWDFGSGNFTVDAWVRLNSVSIDQGILGQLSSDNPAGNRWILSYNNDQNRIYFNVVEGGSNLMTLYSGWTPVADTWYHIAVVRAGSNDWHMYIDGVDQSLTGSANIVMPNLDNEFTVGRHITGSGALLYFNGYIDELRISKGIARWTSGFTPPTEAYSAAATAPNATLFNISLGSTNFSVMSDFTSVSGMVLATSYGSISWSANVNADGQNYDSYVVIGDGFVSVDTASLHSTINQSANVSLAVDNCDDTSIYYASGAFAAADAVRNQDTLCTANTDTSCSDVVCAGGRLNFTASHFTGFAAGSNANLTIWDGAEGSSQDCDTVVDVYANYTNKTSGDFITGADCNVSFSDDGYSAVYGMEEQGPVYHNDSKSFSLAGVYFYNVTCDHPGFNRLSALDNITIQGVLCDGGEPAPIPEFSTLGIIFVIVLSIFGTSLIVRKKK